MKSFGILLILITVAGCDPYGFGFKKNPAYVLDEAFKAITNQDTETFLEMTGKEALYDPATKRLNKEVPCKCQLN